MRMAKDNRPFDPMGRLGLLEQGFQATSRPGYEYRLQSSCHGITTSSMSRSKAGCSHASRAGFRGLDWRYRRAPDPRLGGTAIASVHYGQNLNLSMLAISHGSVSAQAAQDETLADAGVARNYLSPDIAKTAPPICSAGSGLVDRCRPRQRRLAATQARQKSRWCQPANSGLR